MPYHGSLIIISFLLLYHSSTSQGLNILQIAPGWSSSHVLFNYRIAKTLTERGHNVTILMHMMVPNLPTRNVPNGVELIRFQPKFSDTVLKGSYTMFQNLAFQEANFTEFMAMGKLFQRMAVQTCEEILNDHDLLDHLRSKNFDITLSHFFFLCPAGWSHRIGVKKFIWIATGAFIFENVAWKADLPHLSSYMPSHIMKGASDRMSFSQRVTNTLFAAMFGIGVLDEKFAIFGSNTENTVFRQPPYHTDKDPNLSVLNSETITILINGEPFLDFAKPMLPGMAYLGDFEEKVVKKLPEVRKGYSGCLGDRQRSSSDTFLIVGMAKSYG